MAGRPTSGGDLTEHMMAEVIKSDPKTLARIHNLIDLALDQAEDMLKNGSPDIRMQALKTVTPAINRALEVKKNDDAGTVQMRAMLQEMLTEIRGTEAIN